MPVASTNGAAIDDLRQNLPRYLEAFDQTRPFSGPVVHLYNRTMATLPRLEYLTPDHPWMEVAYATLAAWGMHRMGEEHGPKLAPYGEFCKAMQQVAARVVSLQGRAITRYPATPEGRKEVADIARFLAPTMGTNGFSTTESTLVVGAKTLSFLLPGLVPPMDRQYTLPFFYGRADQAWCHGAEAETRFAQMFTAFHEVAVANEKVLRTHAGPLAYMCGGVAKGLDNAVVGRAISLRQVQPA